MPATLKMKKGIELYEEIAQRDYSGNDADQYAQLLQTLFSHLRSDLFPLLEKAEQEGKKLALIEPKDQRILVNKYSLNNLLFV